jgi:hypothetical protein
MPEDLFKEMRELHHRIHREDPPPADERERQAALVLDLMQRSVMDLVLEGMAPTILETALFYHWLRFTTWNHGHSEETFERGSQDMDSVMRPLILQLKEVAAAIEDEGSSTLMEALGERVQQVKNLYSSLAKPTLPRSEVERQSEVTLRRIFRLVVTCLDHKVNPSLLEGTFLYYWLRTSTINANVPEAIFQKLERNWPEVVKRIGAWVEMW